MFSKVPEKPKKALNIKLVLIMCFDNIEWNKDIVHALYFGPGMLKTFPHKVAVIASSLDAILAYEMSHRNTLLSGGRETCM